jgi:pimeloyl-ACP methyl ester carboxylesterase
VPRWLKITLGVIAGLVVLLALNAIVISNATKDAYVRDAGARLIDTSNGTIQVLDQGNQNIRPPQTPRPGNPIVLIHCYTCSMNWWDRLAPLLESDHRVIRVDLLGHGGSDKPGAGYSIDDQATTVAEALAKLGIVNATVVGHSLGGSVATALAQRSPQLASHVVIIDQAPEDGFEHESLAQHLSYWPIVGQALDRLMQITPKSVVRGQFDIAFAPGYDISSGFDNPDQPVDDLRAMTYTAYSDTSDEEQDFVDEQPLDQRLAAAHVPALVIFGAEDQIYDAQAAVARYRQNVPGVQTHLIPGAGHSPNVEKPELVAPLILAFAQPPQPAKKPARK